VYELFVKSAQIGGVLYDSEFIQVLSTGERCSPLPMFVGLSRVVR